MLQQTSAGQVLGVYPEFVERYPAPTAIVDTAEDDLAEEIRPLGLSKRAKHFTRVREQILEEHDGRVPTEPSDLLKLHGVGGYTVRPVLAHAHGEDVPAVDTNVERVLSRAFESRSGGEPSTGDIQRIAERIAPEGSSSDFTHALIDLGGKCAPQPTPTAPTA